MPKDVILRPNMRIDIPDFEDKTSVFSRESDKLELERFILDNQSVATEGFRVEIANQGTDPGLFTIVNGTAFNRAGQLVNNEIDTIATRSATLSVNATYFVEIEFIETESDTDARAHWDPTYNNGTDPSGDVRPDGREFSRAVATRRTPDWQIVTPISTSGFARTTNPNSTRVPIAVLTLSGGVITGGTTTPLRSVITTSIPISSSVVRLFNTKEMPDSFTIRLNPGGATQEDVGVITNDRDNHILTLGSNTLFAHSAGERVVVAGVTPAEYLIERTTPDLPIAGTADARPRFFQGDAARGSYIAIDPAGSGSDRSDNQIITLKRYVDFLAGQLRELKFGGGTSTTVGNTAPPSAFTNATDYFDFSGSVVGARTNTVSVGDGITSFGDFNTTTSGSAAAAINAALDVLGGSSGSGVLYIKRGTYLLSSTITVDHHVKIMGDGLGNAGTILRGNSTGAVFNINIPTLGGATATVVFESLQMDMPGTGPFCLTITAIQANSKITINNCQIAGMHLTDNMLIQDSIIGTTSNSDIAITHKTGSTAVALVAFRNCYLFNPTTGASKRIVQLNTADSIEFDNCKIIQFGTATYLIEFQGVATNIRAVACSIDTTGVNATAVFQFTGTPVNIMLGPNNLNTAGPLSNVFSGSETLSIVGNIALASGVRMREDFVNGTQYVGIKPPSSIASSFDLELPSALPSQTSFLKVTAAGVWTYSADITHGDRLLMITPHAGSKVEQLLGGGVRDSGGRWVSQGSSHVCQLDVGLFVGCRIKRFRCFINGASAGLKRMNLVSLSNGGLAGTPEEFTSTATGDTVIDSGVLPTPYTVVADPIYFVSFRAAVSGDECYGFEVTYDLP